MYVWVFGRGLPSKKNNMYGSFEFEQAEMLAHAGHKVVYLTLDIFSIRGIRRFGCIHSKKNGMDILTLTLPIGRVLPCSIWSLVCRKILFGRVLDRAAKLFGVPDIIHVHYPSLYPYKPFERLQKQGAKIVATEHWSQVQEKNLPDINLSMLKEFVEKADGLLCVGKPLKQSVIDLTGTDREIQVVPNFVPDLFFKEITPLPHKPFRFVAVGRLVSGKQFDLLIEAFVQAFKDNKDVFLDIIGFGDQYSVLEELIGSIQCGDQVTLLGSMDRTEIEQYYRKCHALVISSNLETFGVPLIEAFACGMPVVTTNVLGALEYTSHENTVVVEPDNKEQLAEAMVKLWQNYENYDRKAIAEFAKEHFSEDVIARRLDDIYNGIK